MEMHIPQILVMILEVLTMAEAMWVMVMEVQVV
jgi:hypothetical protein